MNILVVDDEAPMVNILRRILVNDGYNVETADNGETALQYIEKNIPDLIILDLMMPGMSGREVCGAVRQFSKDTKIIYFTAMIEADHKKMKAIKNEANALITKPASGTQILNQVNTLLDKA